MKHNYRITTLVAFAIFVLQISLSRAAERPLLRDFLGLNVHTVSFKPELYRPVCRHLRDYHPLDWDTGKDLASATRFPMADNGVPWDQLYGTWTKDGYDVDACVIFDNVAPGDWKNPAADGEKYGRAFAQYFGPSGQHPWVSSVEVGNEPSKYSAEQYRAIFRGMARGLRKGDAKMMIATCAVMTGKPDAWSKPMSAIDGLGDLFDVVNMHSYAFKDGWPTWHRSNPEDPSIRHLKDIQDVIQYRNDHFPGKQVWLTEFGYDAATHPPDPKGEWSKWVGVSDRQQAEYIVRSFLLFSAMDLDRAYLYFFNDKDEAQLHGVSGITRNYKPKPSFYAVGYLYKTLGDCRFKQTLAKRDGDLYCYAYQSAGAKPRQVFVAWSPTDKNEATEKLIPIPEGSRIEHVEEMPLSNAEPAKVSFVQNDGVHVKVGGVPIFFFAR